MSPSVRLRKGFFVGRAGEKTGGAGKERRREMSREHNFTSVLTLPAKQIEEAVRMYIQGGYAGYDFGECPVLGVKIEPWDEDRAYLNCRAQVTLQTDGFERSERTRGKVARAELDEASAPSPGRSEETAAYRVTDSWLLDRDGKPLGRDVDVEECRDGNGDVADGEDYGCRTVPGADRRRKE